MAKQNKKSQAQPNKEYQITITLAENGGLKVNTNIGTLMTAMALAEASQTVLARLVEQSSPVEQLTEEEVAVSEATPE